MPNIEIHGVVATSEDDVRNRIIAALTSAEYVEDVVISWVRSVVRCTRDGTQEFIRILATKEALDKHLDDMLKRLGSVEFDIEVIELKRFVPKK